MTVNIKCDLHGFTLEDAREEIINVLNSCWKAKKYCITFIHGYHRGQVLRNYLQSQQFLEEMESEGFQLFRVDKVDPGISIFILKNPCWTDNKNKQAFDIAVKEKQVELKNITNEKVWIGKKIDIFEAKILFEAI